MSATVHSDADRAPSSDESPTKFDRLHTYLSDRAADEGELYVKSKFIADDVGLSPKEIGQLMVRLQRSAADLEVEQWSYTSATTWRIAPQDPA